MARTRSIYQSDLLYVGPTGINPATGKHSSTAPYRGNPPSVAELTSGDQFIYEMFRVQSANYNFSKTLTDVNQFGELAAIDRIPLEQPGVSLTYNYILSNFINEQLMGLTVNKAGDTQDISVLSGILNNETDSKNYFIKTVSEGNDAIDFNPGTYNVIALGNGFISSYTSQGSVGSFPTVDVTVDALNIQSDQITSTTGAIIPAVTPSDGTSITGYLYRLPTGLTSYNNLGLTANQGISALRPESITFSLGLGAGDLFFDPNDLKIQSYNVSFNTNREDLNKLGSKYAFAKVINFPLTASMQIDAVCGDIQTGNLINIVNDNESFSPTIRITKPGDTSTVICQYKLVGAKLDNQDVTSSIGANKSVSLTFSAQVGSAQSTNGLFLSGIVL